MEFTRQGASAETRRPSRSYVEKILGVLASFATQVAKNIVKRLIGRKPFRSDLYKFSSRHIWHLVRFRPIEKLTVADYLNHEGAGSKALMTMFTISLCRAYGIEYVHTPFHRLARADGDQEQWDAGWEAFFNLGLGEKNVGDTSSGVFDYFQLSYIKTPGPAKWIEFLKPPLPADRPHYYLDFPVEEDATKTEVHEQRFVQLLQVQRPTFRARYRKNKASREVGPFTVCVHIRRGDVQPDREDMWTDLSCYLACLDAITETLAGQAIDYRIQICSEGLREEFRDLDKFDADWFLDEDARRSMQRLIDADVIVIAKSCFSYVAALLSEGVVIFEPGYLPGLDGWIARDREGHLDRAAFERQLLAYTTDKK